MNSTSRTLDNAPIGSAITDAIQAVDAIQTANIATNTTGVTGHTRV